MVNIFVRGNSHSLRVFANIVWKMEIEARLSNCRLNRN